MWVLNPGSWSLDLLLILDCASLLLFTCQQRIFNEPLSSLLLSSVWVLSFPYLYMQLVHNCAVLVQHSLLVNPTTLFVTFWRMAVSPPPLPLWIRLVHEFSCSIVFSTVSCAFTDWLAPGCCGASVPCQYSLWWNVLFCLGSECRALSFCIKAPLLCVIHFYIWVTLCWKSLQLLLLLLTDTTDTLILNDSRSMYIRFLELAITTSIIIAFYHYHHRNCYNCNTWYDASLTYCTTTLACVFIL